jgi:hypothetical protein
MWNRPPRWKVTRPLSPEEKYGHIWAGVFLFIAGVLLVTLVGKACLSAG